MGFENWLHKKLAPFLADDKEYLIMVVGLAGIALFLYALVTT